LSSLNHPLPKLSLCIPAFNEEQNLLPLLSFLRSEVEQLGYPVEVLIDVSGSNDGSPSVAERMAAQWPAVRVINVGPRDGLLVALARLIGAAQGSLAVRIDADVRLAPGALARLVAYMEDPSIGIVGPRIVSAGGPSGFVNRIATANWAIHDQVSRLEPKTTVIQVFRRGEGELPGDAGVEDVALQATATRGGRRAVYVPEAVVTISPPASVKGVLLQRIRTIRHTRRHVAQGYARPSTASLKLIGRATLDALRSGTSIGSIALFFLAEASARISARLSTVSPGRPPFHWDPIDGTKSHRWEVLPLAQTTTLALPVSVSEPSHTIFTWEAAPASRLHGWPPRSSTPSSVGDAQSPQIGT
jgi:glycosyl transferase family 2